MQLKTVLWCFFPLGTYYLQGIHIISKVDGTVGLKCMFAQGSQLQKCQVTLCQKDNGSNCQNINNNGKILTDLSSLPPGLYTIREAAQLTSDGRVVVRHYIVHFPDVIVHNSSPCPCLYDRAAIGMIIT